MPGCTHVRTCVHAGYATVKYMYNVAYQRFDVLYKTQNWVFNLVSYIYCRGSERTYYDHIFYIEVVVDIG